MWILGTRLVKTVWTGNKSTSTICCIQIIDTTLIQAVISEPPLHSNANSYFLDTYLYYMCIVQGIII